MRRIDSRPARLGFAAVAGLALLAAVPSGAGLKRSQRPIPQKSFRLPAAKPKSVRGAEFPPVKPRKGVDPIERAPKLKRGPFRPAKIGKPTPVTGARLAQDAVGITAPGASSATSLLRVVDFASVVPGSTAEYEVSEASAGKIAFETGNFFAAWSDNRGASGSWRALDPSTVFPNADGGFCCDQEVIYAPQINRFIWILEYWPRNKDSTDPAMRNNRLRVAVASPAQVASSSGTAWTYWDLTSPAFGKSGSFFDYSHPAIGPNYLYLPWLVAAGGRYESIVSRLSLADLAAARTLTGRYLVVPSTYYVRVAQNGGTRAFFAKENSTSQLRVFYWDESSTLVYHVDIDIASIPTVNWTSATPGQDWLAKGAPREGIVAATKTGNQLWFGWSAGRDVDLGDGKTRRVVSQPHIEIAIIDTTRLSLTGQRYIWFPDYAYNFPSLATNADNEVGMAYQWGGNGTRWANGAVGLLTGTTSLVSVSSGNSGMQGGDYNTVRVDSPTSRCFSAGTSTQVGGDRGAKNHPIFVLFGREGGGCKRP